MHHGSTPPKNDSIICLSLFEGLVYTRNKKPFRSEVSCAASQPAPIRTCFARVCGSRRLWAASGQPACLEHEVPASQAHLTTIHGRSVHVVAYKCRMQHCLCIPTWSRADVHDLHVACNAPIPGRHQVGIDACSVWKALHLGSRDSQGGMHHGSLPPAAPKPKAIRCGSAAWPSLKELVHQQATRLYTHPQSTEDNGPTLSRLPTPSLNSDAAWCSVEQA